MKKDCPLCISINCSPWNRRGPEKQPATRHLQTRPDMIGSRSSSGYSDQRYNNIGDTDSVIIRELDETRIRLIAFESRVDNLEKQISDRLEARLLPKEPRRKSVLASNEWRESLANTTTIHGLKEVLTERQKVRLGCWIIIFLTALFFTGYYTRNVIKEYNVNPTATKVKIDRRNEYEYPVVLLCPDTWLDASKALSMNLSEAGLQFALGFLINYGVTKAPYVIDDYLKAKNDFETWWYNDRGREFATLADFFKYVALESKDFVIACSYCYLLQEESNPFGKIIMNEGVCYNLSIPPTDGRVALSDLEYLYVKMPIRSRNLLSLRSYWRYIVNPDLSLGMSETHYLQVFPNHSNTIRVMTHHFKSLPNDRCVTQEYVLINNYSQSACVADCFTNVSLECHAYPLLRSTAIPKNVSKLCNTAKLVANMETTEAKIVDTPPDCIQLCPSLCEKWVYESSVEAHELLDVEEEGITSFHFLNQAVHYGGILSHEEVATYSFETLVSNIGGQMGLWLGASLMSWVELCMFCLTCTCGFAKKKWKNEDAKSAEGN